MTLVINPVVQQQTIEINSFGIGLNGLPNGATESLIELKYQFSAFPVNSVPSDVAYGDVVCFNGAVDSSLNPYEVALEKASTGNSLHANKNLFVFVSYNNSNLILMHKGYVDFENTTSASLNSWIAGEGIYINNGNISITSPQTSGHWVKSIGFCMPNTENTKRIWFEPDSTYFTIA
tara:strand:+ start:1038 stop:1568 length:531 start_codon:yes stop_codon:yes gene_type:complete